MKPSIDTLYPEYISVLWGCMYVHVHPHIYILIHFYHAVYTQAHTYMLARSIQAIAGIYILFCVLVSHENSNELYFNRKSFIVISFLSVVKKFNFAGVTVSTIPTFMNQ